MARVTFLMSLYNGETFLAETLKSLLAQDFEDFNILIIDDGSTDGWQNVLDRFNQKRIKVHSHSNRGLVESLNVGLNMIDCEYIARADADDVYFPNRLSTQIEYMEFAGLDAISNRVLNMDTQGHIVDLSIHWDAVWLQDPTYFPAREPYLSHPFLTAKLSSMREVGGYRHAHLCEDADLYWRLFRNHKIIVHEEILGKYRIHSGSISSNAINRGRVQAFYSQLAALNEQRYRAGRDEIKYIPSLNDEMARGESLPALMAPYQARMSQDEANWLMAASSAKLVDLGGWRNYILGDEDINFAISSYANVKIDDFKNRDELRAHLARARARQVKYGVTHAENGPSFTEKFLNRRPIK